MLKIPYVPVGPEGILPEHEKRAQLAQTSRCL